MAIPSLGCSRAFTTLASTNFEAVVAFYSGLLEQQAIPYQPDRYAEFHLPGLRLGVFKPRADQAAQFSAPSSGGMSLCLEVGDLEGAIAHLSALGYPPPKPMLMDSHGREVYAYDPDGNRLILHQSLGAIVPAQPAQ